MRIFNNACVQDPIAFEPTIWPSSIRSEATGEVLLFSRPMSTSLYVPPTICFGSLVFEHQENVDSQLYTRHKGLIRSLSGVYQSIYPRVRCVLNRIAGTILTSTTQRMKSTLCKTVASVRHLSIGRLSTPRDQRFAHPKVPMKNRKTCTSLR